MAGVKGRSGRVKSPYRIYAEWVKEAENNGTLTDLLEKLKDMALAGDREAAIYLVDRIEGKPKISVDQRIRGALISATPEDYKRASELTQIDKENEAKLLDVEKGKYLVGEVADHSPQQISAN